MPRSLCHAYAQSRYWREAHARHIAERACARSGAAARKRWLRSSPAMRSITACGGEAQRARARREKMARACYGVQRECWRVAVLRAYDMRDSMSSRGARHECQVAAATRKEMRKRQAIRVAAARAQDTQNRAARRRQQVGAKSKSQVCGSVRGRKGGAVWRSALLFDGVSRQQRKLRDGCSRPIVAHLPVHAARYCLC